MFAVIEIGGSQYKVSPKDTIEVKKLDLKLDQEVELKDVVLLANSDKDVKIGQPYVTGAVVKAKVVSQHKSDKVLVVKFTAKKRFKKRVGARQDVTKLEILDIQG